jgi:hypothetical protein
MSGFFSSLSELFAPNKISFSKQGKGKGECGGVELF